ncbi:MAG: threonine ammonia-lyase [Gammaproteobacteria bacterium]
MNPKEFPINLDEVMQARDVVNLHLPPTSLLRYEGLSRLIGADVYVKHEHHNPTGSFKIRGGLNLMHHLKERGTPGVVTFSTGNHGLSIATAAAMSGISAAVVVPRGNNPTKNRAIVEAGAELVEAGGSFEEAAEQVDAIVADRGWYYAHPADEPHLINGVGTEFLEIVQALPDIDVMIVPVGAGSEAAAAATVLKAFHPLVEIIAVQAEASPAAYLSWQAQRIMSAANSTFAGGFATGAAYRTPFDLYHHALSDFALLSEHELYEGIALAMYYTHQLLEGAGAAPLRLAIKMREQLKGKKVVLQMSGCNASPDELRMAMALPELEHGFRG